jgi:putative tryptophan/tyrosine transport system substrate-binding protein
MRRGTDGVPTAIKRTAEKACSRIRYAENRNVTIDYRWLEGEYDRVPAMVADLIGRQVVAVFAIGIALMRPLMAQTSTIPIVFSIGEDPVKEGFVSNLSRPGGNVTGFANFQNLLGSKKLGLLRDSFPHATTFGLLVNPTNPNADPDAMDMQATAEALHRQLQVFTASAARDLAPAFAAMAERRIDALCVNTDPVFMELREQMSALAARHALPAMYDRREFLMAGGLMSYGTIETEMIRQAGAYVERILKGARPADLPVQQSTKFEFVINLKAARAYIWTSPRRFSRSPTRSSNRRDA